MAMLYLRNKPIGAISRVTMPASSVTYDSGTVEDALDDLNTDSGWLTTTAVNGNTLKYRKIGKQVWLKKGTSGTFTADAWNTVANLPDGFRPASNLVDCTYYKLPTYQSILILTTGAVQIVANGTSIYDFCISFLID